MKKLADPTKDEETALEVRPGDLLSTIAKAATDPNVDVLKMQQLYQLYREIVAEQRRVDFDEAMSRLQSKVQQMPKYGHGKNNKFSKYEDIDAILKPLLAEEGFSLSFNEEESKDDKVRFVLTVSRAGHSKPHYLTVHTDKAAKNRESNSIRPAIQDDGSTASYARRYLIKLALNIVEKGEDTNGESLQPITAEQAKDIESLITEVAADKKRFLSYMESESVETILAKDHKKAITALESKRRK